MMMKKYALATVATSESSCFTPSKESTILIQNNPKSTVIIIEITWPGCVIAWYTIHVHIAI